MQKRILSALGLCARARKLIIGVSMITDGLAQMRVQPYLVAEASDTSAATHKKVTDKCRYYHIPLVRLEADGEALGHAVGKEGAVGAVAVTDPSLNEAVRKALERAGYRME
ncbi:MAG: ribosomal L7Ae/L30e/S12e/Gadd45 family protein [Clostridia bacterium]|nr:ribosomal L7Ae/L30e/S12e/Gadd45 family protein [Clostridia bacterium]